MSRKSLPLRFFSWDRVSVITSNLSLRQRGLASNSDQRSAPSHLARSAYPTTVSIPKLCVGQSFCVGAALCGRPPPGNHIGLPLRRLQRFLAMSSRRYEFFWFLPLCTDLT